MSCLQPVPDTLLPVPAPCTDSKHVVIPDLSNVLDSVLDVVSESMDDDMLSEHPLQDRAREHQHHPHRTGRSGSGAEHGQGHGHGEEQSSSLGMA